MLILLFKKFIKICKYILCIDLRPNAQLSKQVCFLPSICSLSYPHSKTNSHLKLRKTNNDIKTNY
ncbi:hypothetical protein Mgra_00009399, partial [Meloidogyne graminicola]